MDQHVNFTPIEATYRFGDELVPVFVQDREDYPSEVCVATSCPDFPEDDFDDCDF